MTVPVKVRRVGDGALCVELSGRSPTGVARWAARLGGSLEAAQLEPVREVSWAGGTVYLHLWPWAADEAGELAQEVERMAHAVRKPIPGRLSPRRVVLPVVYGGTYGPDLEEVAGETGLSPQEVVARHAARVYTVLWLGFRPGFPYLGFTHPSLRVARRASPRARVPAGSVGLAGRQTGIYPADSPGGWRLIGWTPVPLFRPDAPSPGDASLLRPGDRVRFAPATEEEARDPSWPRVERA